MFQIGCVLIVSRCVAVPDIPNQGGCVNCGHPHWDTQMRFQLLLVTLDPYYMFPSLFLHFLSLTACFQDLLPIFAYFRLFLTILFIFNHSRILESFFKPFISIFDIHYHASSLSQKKGMSTCQQASTDEN